MHKATAHLPVWKDPDIDWDKAFEEFLAENKTLAYMMLKNAKVYKDAGILTQKNIMGEWETLSWNEFADRFTAVAKVLIDMGIAPEICVQCLHATVPNGPYLTWGFWPPGQYQCLYMPPTPKKKQSILSMMPKLKWFLSVIRINMTGQQKSSLIIPFLSLS